MHSYGNQTVNVFNQVHLGELFQLVSHSDFLQVPMDEVKNSVCSPMWSCRYDEIKTSNKHWNLICFSIFFISKCSCFFTMFFSTIMYFFFFCPSFSVRFSYLPHLLPYVIHLLRFQLLALNSSLPISSSEGCGAGTSSSSVSSCWLPYSLHPFPSFPPLHLHKQQGFPPQFPMYLIQPSNLSFD